MLTGREKLNCMKLCVHAGGGENGVYMPVNRSERYVLLESGKLRVQLIHANIDDVLYIAFQGSKDTFDWVKNFKATKYLTCNFGGVDIHDGFEEMYSVFLEQWWETEEIQNWITGFDRVIFTGHSQGAALAILALFDNARIDVCGSKYDGSVFAAPRCGTRSFRDEFNRLIPDFEWHRFGNDIVTHLPTAIRGFRHVGEMVQLGPKRLLWSFRDHYLQNYDKALRRSIIKSEVGIMIERNLGSDDKLKY